MFDGKTVAETEDVRHPERDLDAAVSSLPVKGEQREDGITQVLDTVDFDAKALPRLAEGRPELLEPGTAAVDGVDPGEGLRGPPNVLRASSVQAVCSMKSIMGLLSLTSATSIRPFTM